ncbi:ion channel [Lactococcus garvieae]|uniref:Ion channel n=1 Tax=Lactococcus garvieae TaxID=1363 RepID=A0AA46TUD8_9LACT|nr:ion channel [Lactococcus garvieae]UYT09700.1 ion channel [Lactococcus garvieae]UYT11634.1 ion channel [Lactococcus garvieae]
MKLLDKIYNSEYYTIFIVSLALISLFARISNNIDLLINSFFIIDLFIASFLFIKSTNKSFKNYFKLHLADILSCIPIQFLSIFKTFRLIRLVRISRLFKLTRTTKVSNKITISNLFRIETFKELLIYLSIYLIGNIYIFREIEQVTDLDALYWVAATITTVGYGGHISHPSFNKNHGYFSNGYWGCCNGLY